MSIILRACMKYGRKYTKLSTWVILGSRGDVSEGGGKGNGGEAKRLNM